MTTTLTTRVDAALRALEEVVTVAGAAVVGLATYRDTHDMQAAAAAAAGTSAGKQMIGLLLSWGRTSGVVKALKIIKPIASDVVIAAPQIEATLPAGDAKVVADTAAVVEAAMDRWNALYPAEGV